MHTKTIILFIISFYIHAASAQSKKPNIILIFADDWGFGDLGVHGNKLVHTPNLDALAASGIDFHQFTVGNPVCSPSRAAVMTGQFPARNSIHQHFATVRSNEMNKMPDWLDPDLPHFPKLLQKAGYKTGHFGKWHLSNSQVPDAPEPTRYGFDESGVFNGTGRRISLKDVCSEAIEFVEKNKNEPFFMNVWIHETHTGFFPEDSLMKKYENLGEQQQVYSSVIEEADRGIGKLIEKLVDLGLRDNTLVVFSSDNGPEQSNESGRYYIDDENDNKRGFGTYYSVGSAAGMRGKKRSLYEGGIRVPFIVSWPGMITGRQVDTKSVLNSVDLYPTFLSVAGVEVPDNYLLDGESMVDVFQGKRLKRKKPIFWEWQGTHAGSNWPEFGVRYGKWKLVGTYDKSHFELYDLKEATTIESNEKNYAMKKKQLVSALYEMALAWKKTLPVKPDKDCISKLRSESRN